MWTQPETLLAAAALLDPQVVVGDIFGSEPEDVSGETPNPTTEPQAALENKPSQISGNSTQSLPEVSETPAKPENKGKR